LLALHGASPPAAVETLRSPAGVPLPPASAVELTRPVRYFSDMKRRVHSAWAVVVVGLVVPRAAQPADFYVAAGGDDAAAGTAAEPWATVSYAAGQIGPGDTVHVAPGDYAENITTSIDGTADARVVFVSDEHWGARITADAESAWSQYGSYVDVVGFDITGSGRLGITNYGSYVRIIGNHVHDIPAPCGSNGGAAIDNADYAAQDSDMIANVVHDIGSLDGDCHSVHGLYHANLRGHVYNNIAFRNAGWGIHTWHAPVDVVIANNLVFENGQGGIIVGAGDSPGGVTADGFWVANNISIYNREYGINEGGLTGTNNRYVNNILYGNALGPISLQNGNVDEGTIEEDPALLDYQPDGSGDYHLTAGSPAIDTGVAEQAPADDLDGVVRPQGAGFDIGPYEWTPPVPDAGPGDDAGPEPDAGAGGSHDGGADAGAATGATNSDEDGGCGCRLADGQRGTSMAPLLALLGLAARKARRLRARS
jgi:hypothetical protein